MKTDIRIRGLELPSMLTDRAERRVRLQLNRFGHEISSVQLRLSDVNGAKGGEDKQCRVSVRGRRLALVVIEERSADAGSAIDAAVKRAAHVVARELERTRAARTWALAPRKAS